MALACGIDLIELARFETMFEGCEPAQLATVFTPDEIDYCLGKATATHSFAARFAAKEAVMKCFPKETTLKDLDFKDIEVAVDGYGAPRIVLTDTLRALLAAAEQSQLHLSLTHTAHYACAVAIAE